MPNPVTPAHINKSWRISGAHRRTPPGAYQQKAIQKQWAAHTDAYQKGFRLKIGGARMRGGGSHGAICFEP